ncbi:protein ANTAGONIST OF LIKE HETEROCHROMATIN PROTEIN 1-like [Primulina tabacum]|uniref:protein ANTAGONIST OF LIKE HETEROCHROMATIN PROTEIN 1-like n=1 Tax=Primulina tabacum TaxID=48773 RepID=UPI003F5A4DED
MSHSSRSSSSSSSSSPTSEDEVQAEVNDEICDPGEEMMLCMLELSREIHESSESSNDIRRRRRFIQRNREAGHLRLVNDYFSASPVYQDYIFRRRFRMRRELFIHIVKALEANSMYFQMRNDAARRKGLSPLQKCTAAIRQLAYGVPADHLDEYLRMGESTAIKCLFKFCQNVVEIFGDRYLRRPNADDIQCLLQMHEEKHKFPGMLGSLDCMHWQWKNCPVAWKGQFTRGHGSPTIVLEAVASQDLWIWHAFFGVAGSRNDINVLYESPIFNNILQENAPEINFTVNVTHYTKGYYLTDGIYPEWATFVKAFPCPEYPERRLFKERQESARKDVERAFGVLQSRWAIVRGPARYWYRKKLKYIMLTCIILHNMIVEDDGCNVTNWSNDEGDEPAQPVQGSNRGFHDYLRRNSELCDSQLHHQLRADLVEHIWTEYNNN